MRENEFLTSLQSLMNNYLSECKLQFGGNLGAWRYQQMSRMNGKNKS